MRKRATDSDWMPAARQPTEEQMAFACSTAATTDMAATGKQHRINTSLHTLLAQIRKQSLLREDRASLSNTQKQTYQRPSHCTVMNCTDVIPQRLASSRMANNNKHRRPTCCWKTAMRDPWVPPPAQTQTLQSTTSGNRLAAMADRA